MIANYLSFFKPSALLIYPKAPLVYQNKVVSLQRVCERKT